MSLVEHEGEHDRRETGKGLARLDPDCTTVHPFKFNGDCLEEVFCLCLRSKAKDEPRFRLFPITILGVPGSEGVSTALQVYIPAELGPVAGELAWYADREEGLGWLCGKHCRVWVNIQELGEQVRKDPMAFCGPVITC